MYHLTFLSTIAFSLASTSAQAEPPEKKESELVVVTGTRTAKYLSETPIKTQVVTRQMIEESHAKDAKEALENVPGLLLKPIHGKSGYEVWMQGMDSNRVLVLLDSEMLAMSTGSTVDVTQIDSLNIERIEIVKGATSALYGSSAMGGVINIITREVEFGTHFEGKVQAGSFDKDNPSGDREDVVQEYINTRGSYRNDDFYIAGSISRIHSKGFDDDPEDFTTRGPKGPRSTYDLKLGWTPDDIQRHEIYGNLYREDLTSYSDFVAGGKIVKRAKEEESKRTRFGARSFWNTDDYSMTMRFLKERLENITYQDSLNTPVKENHRPAKHGRTQTAFQWDTYKYENHVVTFGADALKEELYQKKDDADEVPDKSRMEFAIYLQDDIFVNEKLELVPGIRSQHDSGFGYFTAPKLNARYELIENDDLNLFLRGGVGLGYRVPNLKERYFIFDHSHLGYMVLGTEDLQPESSESYQLGSGFTHFIDGEEIGTLDFNMFYNDVEKLIETAFDAEATATRAAEEGGNVAVFSYLNIDQSKTYGAELTYEYNAHDDFSIATGYTFTKAKDKITGFNLPNRPRHLIKTSVRYRPELFPITATFSHVYQSSEFIDLNENIKSPGSHIFDLKAGVELTEGFTFYGGIDNITDTQRDFSKFEEDQRSTTGRFFYLGLHYKH